MNNSIDMGTMSSRGQVAIPSHMRTALGLEEGSKVIFLVEHDTLLLKKVDAKTFSQISAPFRQAKKKIKEKDVVSVIHKIRRQSTNSL